MAALGVSARLSRHHVHAAITWLREERWIVVDRRMGKGGILIYQINIPKLMRSSRFVESQPAVRWTKRKKKLPTGDDLLSSHPWTILGESVTYHETLRERRTETAAFSIDSKGGSE